MPGAGVALSLLLNSAVDEIVINDYDKAIYSVWRALLTETDSFIKLIEDTPLSVDEWRARKRIYDEQGDKYSLELGFAAFYLNRTNHSGILSNAGPIGGFDQTGNYLIDARFNRPELVRRVCEIAKYKSKIHLYNKDIRTFWKSICQDIKRELSYTLILLITTKEKHYIKTSSRRWTIKKSLSVLKNSTVLGL